MTFQRSEPRVLMMAGPEEDYASRTSSLPPEGARGRVVSWLHISDFHFKPNDAFDRAAILKALVREVRDFQMRHGWDLDLVFATGDIANAAAREEYERASQFFDEVLKAAGLGREQLFVVPGNHDVYRPAAAFLARTLSSEDQSDAFFASPKQQPHMEKLEAFRAWHDEYFAGHRACAPVSSCSPPEVVNIRGLRVGVLPLNSATFSLDDDDFGKLWIGRPWLERALETMEELNPDIRIALVHHPLDWLHDDERSNVRAKLYASVDVLLRGHLHDTETEMALTRSGDVLHIAAGACYQARRWPKRAMFARADVDTGEVSIAPIRYEDRPHQIWTIDPSVFPRDEHFIGKYKISLKQRAASGPESSVPRSAQHHAPSAPLSRSATYSRLYQVYRDGLAEVTINVQHLKLNGEVILALPAPPFCDIVGDRMATTPHGPMEVQQTAIDGGRRLFSLGGAGVPFGIGSNLEECAWKYRISNAVALHRTDLEFMRTGDSHPRDRWLLDLDGYDGRPHIVHFPTDLMTLVQSFEDDTIESAQAVVERRRDRRGQDRWERVPTEIGRCEVSWDARTANLKVAHPIVGHRYTLAYRPLSAGPRYSTDVLRISREVRTRCRNAPVGSRSLATVLTESIDVEVEPLLGGPLGPAGSWVGLLWHDVRHQLFASFGRFANQTWSARFKYGDGVAGHAFRFCNWTTWHRSDANRTSLIYQPKTEALGSYTHDYRWIVCVPLMVGGTGPAIGVVSFAGPEPASPAEHLLHDLAQDLGAFEGRLPERRRSLVSQLTSRVNSAFWTTLAEDPSLPPGQRDFAKATLVALAQPAVP